MTTKLYNKREVAKLFGVCERTIDMLRQKGDIQYCKVGSQIRFSEEDIRAFIERSRAAHPER